MKPFFRFLISRQFLLNLLGIVLVWVIAIWATFAWVKSYGNYEKNVDVPNFTGLHVDDLNLFVEGKEISYVIFDSVYVDGVAPGTVVSQIPLPTDSSGMPAKPGRVVKLTVVPLSKKQIPMPWLVDKSKFIATKVLQSRGLRYKERFESAPAGKDFVLKQMYQGQPIDSGAMVPEGAKITLVISKGRGNEKETVPNLMGLTLKEAREKIALQSLNLMHNPCENCLSNEEELDAYVVKQIPSGYGDQMVPAGTTVSVWLDAQKPIREDSTGAR